MSEGYELKKDQNLSNVGVLRVDDHIILPHKLKDSVVMLKDKSIVSVKQMFNSEVKVCKFKKIKPAFNYPSCSSLIDICS